MRIAWYPWQMQRIVARRLDAVLFPSRASAELTTRLWSLPPARVHAVYNGVDADLFRPGDEAAREANSLLFVGNAEDYNKGVVYALRAMALLPIDCPAHLYLVGGRAGPAGLAQSEIARLGIGDRVTVVGRVREAELADWYRRAQILLSPSLYEGFGLPAAEAMASGTPVIATDAGALPEVVADGETGIIVPATDPGALADEIVELLANPERGRELGSAGRARVLDRFTWRHHARACEALYRTVIAERRRPGRKLH